MSELIVVHGNPGSGKSTQCELLLSQRLEGMELSHISSGNRLRGIRMGTIASRFSHLVNAQDAPSPLEDALVNDIMFEEIPVGTSLPRLNLLDGYPRHPSAVNLFLERIETGKHKLLGVISLEVSKQVSIDRIVSRGKRDGEKNGESSLVDIAAHRYDLDRETTHRAIELLAKVATVKHLSADGSISEVGREFRSAVQILHNEAGTYE